MDLPMVGLTFVWLGYVQFTIRFPVWLLSGAPVFFFFFGGGGACRLQGDYYTEYPFTQLLTASKLIIQNQRS